MDLSCFILLETGQVWKQFQPGTTFCPASVEARLEVHQGQKGWHRTFE